MKYIFCIAFVSLCAAGVSAEKISATSVKAKPAEKAASSYTVDKKTSLVIDTGFEQVRAHCTACHSGKLVTQNRMSRDTWLETIRWMQKTQALWPLGDAEVVILDYLEKHYHPIKTGRRRALAPDLMPST